MSLSDPRCLINTEADVSAKELDIIKPDLRIDTTCGTVSIERVLQVMQ